MPATRSATRSAASASAVTNELQAVIKEAAEVAVTNLNAMSGYTGGFAAQLGDYFCDTYQGAVGSGSTPDSHTKSRAFIMYTNDENTKLTCVLDLAQWKKKSGENELHSPALARRAEVRAKYLEKCWELQPPGESTDAVASSSNPVIEGVVSGDVGAFLRLRDEISMIDPPKTASKVWLSQLISRVDAIIPELDECMSDQMNSNTHSFVSGKMGNPVKLWFVNSRISETAKYEPSAADTLAELRMGIDWLPQGKISVGQASIWSVDKPPSRREIPRDLCLQSNFDGLSYHIDKPAQEIRSRLAADGASDLYMSDYINSISKSLPTIGKAVGLSDTEATDVECGFEYRVSSIGTGTHATIYVRDKERAADYPTEVTRIKLSSATNVDGNLNPAVEVDTVKPGHETESVQWS